MRRDYIITRQNHMILQTTIIIGHSLSYIQGFSVNIIREFLHVNSLMYVGHYPSVD